MLAKVKDLLYFPIANYFRFFAKIRLKRWKPRILVVTGSNGKTMLFQLLEAQLKGKAQFSYHANSSFGIPFDILDLHRKTLLKTEWLALFLKAPMHAFSSPPKEKIYVVEADADRPHEGKFLAEFLSPEIVLWVSVSKTHSINFDPLVSKGGFSDVAEAIAYEYGTFLEYAQKFVVINGDLPLELQQIDRTKAKVKIIKKERDLGSYQVTKEGTTFTIEKQKYHFNALLPEEIFYAICMCREAVIYFDLPFDPSFAQFTLPPGRGSIFQGIKDITVIDSTYNANLASMQVTLSMFSQLHVKKKWAVIGDMLEQGKGEQEQHKALASLIIDADVERIILLGSRVKKYSFPMITTINKKEIPIDVFENPKEVLDFMLDHLTGGETILFKGARFMEGIIENLLVQKEDAQKLVRREKVWEIRRKQWGF